MLAYTVSVLCVGVCRCVCELTLLLDFALGRLDDDVLWLR
jgi:hypothetical protein